MDYVHEHTLSEPKGPFKGWLTRLLAEAFYLEDEIELPAENHQCPDRPGEINLLQQFTRPYT